jgi:hypothetical protein
LKLCCAVLEDYQDVTAGLADWSAVELWVINHHMTGDAELAALIGDCEAVGRSGIAVKIVEFHLGGAEAPTQPGGDRSRAAKSQRVQPVVATKTSKIH